MAVPLNALVKAALASNKVVQNNVSWIQRFCQKGYLFSNRIWSNPPCNGCKTNSSLVYPKESCDLISLLPSNASSVFSCNNL